MRSYPPGDSRTVRHHSSRNKDFCWKKSNKREIPTGKHITDRGPRLGSYMNVAGRVKRLHSIPLAPHLLGELQQGSQQHFGMTAVHSYLYTHRWFSVSWKCDGFFSLQRNGQEKRRVYNLLEAVTRGKHVYTRGHVYCSRISFSTT